SAWPRTISPFSATVPRSRSGSRRAGSSSGHLKWARSCRYPERGLLARQIGSVAPEIRSRRVLTGFDDRPPDFARSREELEQRLAISPANGALQGSEIFGESRQHFEDRFAVRQADIAPH